MALNTVIQRLGCTALQTSRVFVISPLVIVTGSSTGYATTLSATVPIPDAHLANLAHLAPIFAPEHGKQADYISSASTVTE